MNMFSAGFSEFSSLFSSVCENFNCEVIFVFFLFGLNVIVNEFEVVNRESDVCDDEISKICVLFSSFDEIVHRF